VSPSEVVGNGGCLETKVKGGPDLGGEVCAGKEVLKRCLRGDTGADHRLQLRISLGHSPEDTCGLLVHLLAPFFHWIEGGTVHCGDVEGGRVDHDRRDYALHHLPT